MFDRQVRLVSVRVPVVPGGQGQIDGGRGHRGEGSGAGGKSIGEYGAGLRIGEEALLQLDGLLVDSVLLKKCGEQAGVVAARRRFRSLP